VLDGIVPVGALLILLGMVTLAITWRGWYLLPLDPEEQADIEQCWSIADVDSEAAAAMRRRIFAAAAWREAQRLSALRSQAPLDRRAAVELRNRLRAKVYMTEGLRRSVKRLLGDTPGAPAVLQALDRDVSLTRQRWMEAEQFLQ
jgi:hypothetical protein